MNIGQAADASGVPAKLIRYYESIGLMPEPDRTPAGYRVYSERDVHTLRFIKRARALGCEIEDIRLLLGLWTDERRPSSQVKELAAEHLQKIDAKLDELESLAGTLRHLIDACHGDDRPDCPILDELDREVEEGRAAGARRAVGR